MTPLQFTCSLALKHYKMFALQMGVSFIVINFNVVREMRRSDYKIDLKND